MVDDEAGEFVKLNENNKRWDCDIDNEEGTVIMIFEDKTLLCCMWRPRR